jgi:hypothetical protein
MLTKLPNTEQLSDSILNGIPNFKQQISASEVTSRSADQQIFTLIEEGISLSRWE